MMDGRMDGLQNGMGRGMAAQMMGNPVMSNVMPPQPQIGMGPTNPQMGMGQTGPQMGGGGMAKYDAMMDEFSQMENPFGVPEEAMYGENNNMHMDPRMGRMPQGLLGPAPRRHGGGGQRAPGLRRNPYAPGFPRMMGGNKGHARPPALGRHRRAEFELDEGMGIMNGGGFDEGDEDEDMWQETGT
jgi:hypothetical protein